MNSLGRKVLAASVGALLLLGGLYVLVTGEMDSWNEASAQVMRDYQRAMLDGEFHAALTRAAGETASFALTGDDTYRAEAAEALRQAIAAGTLLREVADEPPFAKDPEHVHYLERQERLLSLMRERLRWASSIASPEGTKVDPGVLQNIYAQEAETDSLWGEIAAHHRGELQKNVQVLRDHNDRARKLFLAGAAAFAIAAIVLIGYVRRRVVGPLTLLARVTQSVAAGDLTQRTKVTHRDEIGQLQRSFNQMVVDLERQRRQLTTLIESLATARDAAEQASRAKSDFLANVSHEIRTPMNGVLIGLDLLHETAPNAEQRELADMARTSARHLLGMLNDLLDFSRIEAGQLDLVLTTFEVRRLVTQMIELHGKRAAAKGVAMSCHIAEDVPTKLCGDPARLGQILLNLLDNAIKFTDQGSIDVSVSVEASTSEPTPPHPAERPVWLRFRVTDTGAGIPPEVAPNIFEPFYQVGGEITRASEGIGLGLGISRQLARMMGGTLGFESDVGKGSSFWFTARLLPDAQRGQAATSDVSPQRRIPSGRRPSRYA